MILTPSDPDIGTLLGRIKENEIDLQPDFQRGEVWGVAKKQRLIDSIIRMWHVPPLHVIELEETGRLEVLDGQQRLVSIRDFADDAFPINGRIEPFDEEIMELDGVLFSGLNEKYRRRFVRFTIRLLTVTQYRASEPAELFFRLNQPAALTSAEKRNAFFGPARSQVKSLVAAMPHHGLTPEAIGFTNSRMAFDDVLARVCVAIEQRGLGRQISSDVLSSRYRADVPFAPGVVGACNEALSLFGGSVERLEYRRAAPFNKATLFTWLYFASTLLREAPKRVGPEVFAGFVRFCLDRAWSKETWLTERAIVRGRIFSNPAFMNEVWVLHVDRSSARVLDVQSVIIRDTSLWCAWIAFAVLTGRERLADIPRCQHMMSIGDSIAATGSHSTPVVVRALFASVMNLHASGRLS